MTMLDTGGPNATLRRRPQKAQAWSKPVNERPVSTSRETLDDLKERHVAFLEARLSAASGRTRAEWRANVASVLDDLLHAPLGMLVEPESLIAALDTAASRAIFDEVLRPALERAAREAHAHLVSERAPIGEFVPKNARDALSDLFARPDLVPPKLVREIAAHDAAQEVMRDILHDALKQFSERVNPFVAEWGLPSLLKKLGPFGLGGVGKSIDGMRVDFEKRLDPEIRKFLQGFSREGLKNAADSVVNRAGTPPFVALRRRLAAFLLEQRLAELLLDAKGSADTTRIALDVAAHLAAHEELTKRRRVFVQSFLETHGKTPLGEVLSGLGFPAKPPPALVDALADATFPALSAALESPSAKRWLRALVAEFYDGLVTTDEHPAAPEDAG